MSANTTTDLARRPDRPCVTRRGELAPADRPIWIAETTACDDERDTPGQRHRCQTGVVEQGAGSEVCERCGGQAEQGQFEVGRSVRWIAEGDERAKAVTWLPFTTIVPPRLPALRCTACRLIWFQY
jgi:hypothetical protein